METNDLIENQRRQIERLQADIEAKGGLAGMFGDSMKKFNEQAEKLRSINLNHLTPKKKKTTKKKHEAILTEGGFVYVQFKTMEEAENYFNSL
jgi:hypothetical protein